MRMYFVECLNEVALGDEGILRWVNKNIKLVFLGVLGWTWDNVTSRNHGDNILFMHFF